MIDCVVEKIKRAKKPLILAGFGVRSANATNELEELATKCDIPVVTSRAGIDVINTDSPLYVGRPGSYGDRASHFAIQEADLLLILGSRLSISTIGYYPDRFGKNAYKVMVDIDDKELAKEDVPVDCKVKADLKQWLNQLLLRIDCCDSHSEWITHCIENKEKYPTVLTEYQKEEPLNEYFVTSVFVIVPPTGTTFMRAL